MAATYHESFEIRPPPLGQTVTNFPFVVDPVCAVELLGVPRRSETDVKLALEAVDFIFARF